MSYQDELQRLLGPAVPHGLEIELIHIRSRPQKKRKLVFTRTHDPALDAASTHYFVVLVEQIAVLALEVLTWDAQDAFTIFVSKADTTGHYTGPQQARPGSADAGCTNSASADSANATSANARPSGRLNMLHVTQALLRLLVVVFAPPEKRVRISLFAKAEQQYLFIGSVNNPRKHVLSDAQLVKWWLRCLDSLDTEFDTSKVVKAALEIPGLDEAVERYFPPQARLPWTKGHIFWNGESPASDENVWAVKRIPRFPDDPKSRFLDAIVAEKRAKKVSSAKFWQELPSRQEFRLAKSVAIIGTEFAPRRSLADLSSGNPPINRRDVEKFKDLLLSMDFASFGKTGENTERLVQAVSQVHRYTIVGTAEAAEAVKKEAPKVNTLMVVRKKRKVQ